MAATAMQVAVFEASWPVLSAIKWDRQYHAMLATPLRVRDVVIGKQLLQVGTASGVDVVLCRYVVTVSHKLLG
jgi:lipooligosaccharide transport system permease protein